MRKLLHRLAHLFGLNDCDHSFWFQDGQVWGGLRCVGCGEEVKDIPARPYPFPIPTASRGGVMAESRVPCNRAATLADLVLTAKVLRQGVECILSEGGEAGEMARQAELLLREVTAIHLLLTQTIAVARQPRLVVDLARVKAAEEAYERGETRPF